MSETLANLLQTPTKQAILAKLIAALQGIGFTQHTKFSPGGVSASGAPNGTYLVQVKIITAGDLGTGVFQYSTDGGATFSANQTIPANGIFVLPGTGCSLVFTNAVPSSSPNFLATDLYNFTLFVTGFPVTSWQPFSVPLALLGNDSEVMEDVYQLLADLGAGGYVQLAAELGLDPWVDLCAEQFFNLSRRSGVSTQGNVVLTDGGQGPFTVAAGGLSVTTAGGLRYTNNAGFTLPQNGTVTGLVTAEQPGSLYNQANDTIQVISSPALPAVTVDNPDPGTGTWITVSGTDQETSLQLAARCIGRWPQLGVGLNGIYDTWAKEASVSVTKTTAYADPVVPGQVNLYIAGSGGAVSGAVVTAVQNYIDQRAPACVQVVVASAANQAVTVQGTVFVSQPLLAQAQEAGEAALQSYIDEAPIGDGATTILYLSTIETSLQLGNASIPVSGVRNVELTLPAADVVLGATHVATLTLALTYVGV